MPGLGKSGTSRMSVLRSGIRGTPVLSHAAGKGSSAVRYCRLSSLSSCRSSRCSWISATCSRLAMPSMISPKRLSRCLFSAASCLFSAASSSAAWRFSATISSTVWVSASCRPVNRSNLSSRVIGLLLLPRRLQDSNTGNKSIGRAPLGLLQNRDCPGGGFHAQDLGHGVPFHFAAADGLRRPGAEFEFLRRAGVELGVLDAVGAVIDGLDHRGRAQQVVLVAGRQNHL